MCMHKHRCVWAYACVYMWMSLCVFCMCTFNIHCAHIGTCICFVYPCAFIHVWDRLCICIHICVCMVSVHVYCVHIWVISCIDIHVRVFMYRLCIVWVCTCCGTLGRHGASGSWSCLFLWPPFWCFSILCWSMGTENENHTHRVTHLSSKRFLSICYVLGSWPQKWKHK